MGYDLPSHLQRRDWDSYKHPLSRQPGCSSQLHAAGAPVVIVSNKGEASVHAILTHFDMHDFVHLVIAARDASPTKPDPRSYFESVGKPGH